MFSAMTWFACAARREHVGERLGSRYTRYGANMIRGRRDVITRHRLDGEARAMRQYTSGQYA